MLPKQSWMQCYNDGVMNRNAASYPCQAIQKKVFRCSIGGSQVILQTMHKKWNNCRVYMFSFIPIMDVFCSLCDPAARITR
eukprot:m.134269 g.134269  ORF g.134269 m.134269 type:complete len:81 (-) comp14690_c0_seq7:2802-3044(-)